VIKMMIPLPYNNKAANALMEYAIIIGVVTMALIAMNVYVKRGVQGKLKDMTDYFIGAEQAVDSNPTARVDSVTRSEYEGNADAHLLQAGGMHLVSLDSVQTIARSKIVDEPKAPITNGPFTPAEKGAVKLPTRPTDEDIKAVYDRGQDEKKITRDSLKRKEERLLQEAISLEDAADQIENSGWQVWNGIKGTMSQTEAAKVWLVGIINNWPSYRISLALISVAWGGRLSNKYMTGEVAEIWKLAAGGGGCDRQQCVQAAIDLYHKGQEVFKQAEDTRAQAALKRQEAQTVQDQIDALEAEIAAGGG